MNRFATMGLALFIVSACVSQPVPPSTPVVGMTCNGNAPNPTWIKYGDSKISAKKVTMIKVDKLWRFILQPDSGYENATVTITGKNPTQTWLATSGTEAADGDLHICVPNTVATGDEFYYMITVQFVGQLDPRADVVN